MGVLRDRRGFSVIEVMIIILVLGLIAFAGLKVYQQQQTTADSGTSVVVSNPVVTDVPETIKTSDDLADVENLLDATDVEADMSSLDYDLAAF